MAPFLKQQVIEKANELGYNVLPLAEDRPVVKPFLIYRNKVAADGFAGAIRNVPCFKGSDFSYAPSSDSASPTYMKQFAPEGMECSVSDFLYRGCGEYVY